jgi:hypothetical protein
MIQLTSSLFYCHSVIISVYTHVSSLLGTRLFRYPFTLNK